VRKTLTPANSTGGESTVHIRRRALRDLLFRAKDLTAAASEGSTGPLRPYWAARAPAKPPPTSPAGLVLGSPAAHGFSLLLIGQSDQFSLLITKLFGRPADGLEVSDAKRLRSLEDENATLKKILAEAMLDNAMLEGVTTDKVTPAAWIGRIIKSNLE
jgi:hypothetical protein